MTALASTPLSLTIEDQSNDWVGPFFVVVGSKADWTGDAWWANFPTRAEAEVYVQEVLSQHPVNPILTNLRADVASGEPLADAVWAYQAEDEDLFDNSWSEDFTVEQRDHARRVLAHLAHFTTTNR